MTNNIIATPAESVVLSRELFEKVREIVYWKMKKYESDAQRYRSNAESYTRAYGYGHYTVKNARDDASECMAKCRQVKKILDSLDEANH